MAKTKGQSAPSHVAIIDPGSRVPELDTFNNLNALSKIRLSYHQPALHGMQSLRLREEGLIGLVILGSGASVHDPLPWQDELTSWLKPLLKKGLPTLGLCYGHQLIAHLFGGEVAFLTPDHQKLRGFREIEIKPTRLWGHGRKGSLVISHREVVTTCPPDFEVIAQSPAVAIDGIGHLSLPIWGLQGHPEATHGFMLNQDISYDQNREAPFAFGHKLVLDFLDHIAQNQG